MPASDGAETAPRAWALTFTVRRTTPFVIDRRTDRQHEPQETWTMPQGNPETAPNPVQNFHLEEPGAVRHTLLNIMRGVFTDSEPELIANLGTATSGTPWEPGRSRSPARPSTEPGRFCSRESPLPRPSTQELARIQAASHTLVGHAARGSQLRLKYLILNFFLNILAIDARSEGHTSRENSYYEFG